MEGRPSKRAFTDARLVQAERLNMGAFSKLHLTQEQLQFFGKLWERWAAGRAALQARMARTAARLTWLPTLAHLPSDFLLTLRSVADGGGGVAGSSTGNARWARELLGASPDAATTAGALIAALREVLADDAGLFARFRVALVDAPRGFTSTQACGLMTHRLENASFAVDTFRMLQMAAVKLRRSVLLPM